MNEEQTQPREVKREFPKPLEGVDWSEVRRACEAGLTLADASRVFGIDREAVKQRAWRENWLHPAKIEALKAEKLKLLESQQAAELSPGYNHGAKKAETAIQALTESMEGYKSRTMLSLLKLAEKGVSRAVSADLPVENWQDAKLVADIAMKLHQVGQESVQVNICNAFADMGEGQLIETETEIVSEDEGEEGGRDAYFVD